MATAAEWWVNSILPLTARNDEARFIGPSGSAAKKINVAEGNFKLKSWYPKANAKLHCRKPTKYDAYGWVDQLRRRKNLRHAKSRR